MFHYYIQKGMVVSRRGLPFQDEEGFLVQGENERMKEGWIILETFRNQGNLFPNNVHKDMKARSGGSRGAVSRSSVRASCRGLSREWHRICGKCVLASGAANGSQVNNCVRPARIATGLRGGAGGPLLGQVLTVSCWTVLGCQGRLTTVGCWGREAFRGLGDVSTEYFWILPTNTAILVDGSWISVLSIVKT